MQTMTALEAFQLSANADVYITTPHGEARIQSGMRTASSVAMVVNLADRSTARVDYPSGQDVEVVRVDR